MKEVIELAGRELYGYDWKTCLCRDAALDRKFLDSVLAEQATGPPEFIGLVLSLLIQGRLHSVTGLATDAARMGHAARAEIFAARARVLASLAKLVGQAMHAALAKKS